MGSRRPSTVTNYPVGCQGRGVLHNRDLKNQPSWTRELSEVTGVTLIGPNLCDRPEPGPHPSHLTALHALADSFPPTKPSCPSFLWEAASRSPSGRQGALTLSNSGTGSQWGSCGLHPRMLCWCPQPA